MYINITMEDDLDSLGVPPSDRKKLESMSLTTLKQIALLMHKKLGMRRSKATTLIRRVPQSIARASFGDITDGTLAAAEDVFRASLLSWG